MNRETLGIADVGEVGEHFQALDEGLAGFAAALDAEHDHGAAFALEVLLVALELRIVFEAGKAHPLDVGVRFQVPGDSEGVLAVAIHAQRQGFNALKELPGIVRGDAGSEVAQGNGAHTQDVGEWRKGFGQIVSPAQSVIRGVRIVVEGMLAGCPVEAPGINNHSADADAVTAHPFGQRVHTMSAPWSNGRVRCGVEKVASTMSGTPQFLA